MGSNPAVRIIQIFSTSALAVSDRGGPFIIIPRGMIDMNEQIENNFKYHAPTPGQPEIYQQIREKAKELAYLIDELVPGSREKSLALTNLEQSVFWANAAVARHDK
ncbi:hypothetical protein [Paenibacillus sp. BR1-192]|uniref:Acb2/Tad1 domain-containing protein n=1 Tax=Paenibacillus sp. BR1-192 TaxID=3032287 RepID=UPI00240D2488|nr:hypothetical protein [Paenibacillus sp. BR1-192]WFB60559.1 hypothetical protein P0X86_10295 [Paenibacillus sp. BR1-192]